MFNYAISKIQDKNFIKNKIYSLKNDENYQFFLIKVEENEEIAIDKNDTDFIFLLNCEKPIVNNFNDLINANIVINCTTEELAQTFLTFCHENGAEWANNKIFQETNWNKFKKDTCYIISSCTFLTRAIIQFSNINKAIKEEYYIIDATDIMI